jgi:hypothetical protein
MKWRGTSHVLVIGAAAHSGAGASIWWWRTNATTRCARPAGAARRAMWNCCQEGVAHEQALARLGYRHGHRGADGVRQQGARLTRRHQWGLMGKPADLIDTPVPFWLCLPCSQDKPAASARHHVPHSRLPETAPAPAGVRSMEGSISIATPILPAARGPTRADRRRFLRLVPARCPGRN